MSRFLNLVLAILPVLALPTLADAADARPRYLDVSLPIDARIDDLLPHLTLDEKIALVHADSKFSTPGVPRLGIPPMWLSDGPHGVREEISRDSWNPAGRTDDFATALPAGIALAATWNPELARAYGAVIAAEARQRNKHIMLGPGVNIMRTPLCGRNFEYYGEDPWLAGRIAIGNINGIQSGEVAACVKHLAVNNQEKWRDSVDVVVDERTLREIYLPAFEAAVREAGVLSVMGAYNKFRGEYCCHNAYLLNDVLNHEWDFKGVVVSDWNGTHDTPQAVRNGLDLEMGTNKPYEDFYLARSFREGVKSGEFPVSLLDDKVRRILRVLFATRAVDGRKPGAMNTRAHQATARRVAEEAIVLLKNSGSLLPLDLNAVKSIAVIGDNATRLQCHGGWSSEIKAFYEISPFDGIVRRIGPRATVSYAAGYTPPPRRRTNVTDAAGVARMEADAAAHKANASELIDRAVQIAKQADVAIIVGGLNHETNQDTEGSDRQSLELPYSQAELIARVTAANPRTIVVLMAGSPVAMDPWLEKTPAVLQAWYGGMEAGNALAAVLFGDVSPSGKLPCTFPKKLADSPAHASGDAKHFPGENGMVHYDEGLLVGYRWNDTRKVEPLFPFGHGLSYTTFTFARLSQWQNDNVQDPMVTVTCQVTNAGAREGSEVVQAYIEDIESSVPRPKQELKAFAKIALKPGETREVSLTLNARSFAFYDVQKKAWVVEKGTFNIHIGRSSRDIAFSARFVQPETIVLASRP